jgi:hypothetical protein
MKRIRRTRKWHKALTLDEIRHIAETTPTGSLEQFRVNYVEQTKMDTGPMAYVCYDCHRIAQKLGSRITD